MGKMTHGKSVLLPGQTHKGIQFSQKHTRWVLVLIVNILREGNLVCKTTDFLVESLLTNLKSTDSVPQIYMT